VEFKFTKYQGVDVNVTKLKVIGVVGLIIFATACDTNHSMMSSEFKSLAECLLGIRYDSKQELKIIIDTPEKVTGFLTNGQSFACQIKRSGTKGVYFEGWYTVKDDK
jgi:hypothetical protein